MSADDGRLDIDGHTFWRAKRPGGVPEELTTETAIELDDDGCRWTVAGPGGTHGEAVTTESREVRRYMGRVATTMARVTRRGEVRSPVPKPTSKQRQLPATAQVPCPACQGAGWFDCELCDGSGVVTHRQAQTWRRDHSG